ncbi:unnamed protein product [Heterobilharzia americana]|nr:unnamed protein product [Heterobilharzia americana]CAH8622836.1 unnamed protein product [Heterobilharzia americana]
MNILETTFKLKSSFYNKSQTFIGVIQSIDAINSQEFQASDRLRILTIEISELYKIKTGLNLVILDFWASTFIYISSTLISSD